jgi:hypothetical protein
MIDAYRKSAAADLERQYDGTGFRNGLDHVSTPRDQWPDPEPLDVDEGTPTMFPLEALPPLMRDVVRDIASALSCNTALAAAGILAAANLAVQDHFDVEFQGGRFRPLSLFLITVAVSGERKSTVDAYTLEGVADFVKEDMRLWKERQDEIEAVRKGNKGKKPAQRKEEPSPLPDPHIIANYGSVQGLFRAFHEGKSSLGLFSDEGGQFLGGHSLGKMENRLHGLASLSKLWDGGTQVTRLRGQDKVSEVLAADDPRLAVHLQAQPIAVQPFLDDRMAKGQGALARFLVHKPASTIGTRITSVERWAASNRTDAVVRFNDRVKACLSRPHEHREDGSIRRYGLRMPRAAQQVLVDYYNGIERQLAPGGTLEGMSDLANKNHENAARIAGTLAAFDGRDGVDAQDMKAGSEIAAYFLSEAIRLARLAPQEEGVQDALAIARWLHERGGRVSNTDLNNGLPTHLRRKKARTKPMALLQEAGWIRQSGKDWELNRACIERGWV